MIRKFFADDNKKSRDGIDETMDGIRSDGKRAGELADDNIKYSQEEIGCDEEIAGFYDYIATGRSFRGRNLGFS